MRRSTRGWLQRDRHRELAVGDLGGEDPHEVLLGTTGSRIQASSRSRSTRTTVDASMARQRRRGPTGGPIRLRPHEDVPLLQQADRPLALGAPEAQGQPADGHQAAARAGRRDVEALPGLEIDPLQPGDGPRQRLVVEADEEVQMAESAPLVGGALHWRWPS